MDIKNIDIKNIINNIIINNFEVAKNWLTKHISSLNISAILASCKEYLTSCYKTLKNAPYSTYFNTGLGIIFANILTLINPKSRISSLSSAGQILVRTATGALIGGSMDLFNYVISKVGYVDEFKHREKGSIPVLKWVGIASSGINVGLTSLMLIHKNNIIDSFKYALIVMGAMVKYTKNKIKDEPQESVTHETRNTQASEGHDPKWFRVCSIPIGTAIDLIDARYSQRSLIDTAPKSYAAGYAASLILEELTRSGWGKGD